MFLKQMKTTHGEPHQTNLRLSRLHWLKLSGGPFISRGHAINLRVGVQAMTKQKGKPECEPVTRGAGLQYQGASSFYFLNKPKILLIIGFGDLNIPHV